MKTGTHTKTTNDSQHLNNPKKSNNYGWGTY